MNDKQKVTFYIPSELHRQLKIRSAVDAEAMSAIAERAIVFYLTHPDMVDAVEMSHGQAHRVYSCPECSSHLVVRDGDMISLHEQTSVISDEELQVSRHLEGTYPDSEQHDREELVPC